MRHSPIQKRIALALTLSIFAMGCRGIEQSGSSNAAATTEATATADLGDEEGMDVCPEVYDTSDPDVCPEEGMESGTTEEFALKTHTAWANDGQCSKERADCINVCNQNFTAQIDTCIKGVAGLAAAEVTAIVGLAGAFKAALARACSAASWSQILKGSGIAILATIVIAAADWLIWAACARNAKNNYNNCVASCPKN